VEHEEQAAPTWRARVIVTLKPVVNDPQGLAIRDGLHQLGYGGVAEARAGKVIDVRLTAPTAEAAAAQVHEMAARLLANPVIEEFTYDVMRDA
jgi:phosphoribosylformylglycinamidine synthase subunit PurS